MEILHTALKGDFSNSKVKPASLEILFDTGEVLKFSNDEFKTRIESELRFDFISTFDRKIAGTRPSDSSFKDLYDTELMRELQSKLEQLIRILNTLLNNPQNVDAINEATLLQKTLQKYINELFNVRKKEILFCRSFKIDDNALQKSIGKIPKRLLNRIEQLRGQVFIPETDFFEELKETVEESTIDQFKDSILSIGELSPAQNIVFVKSDGMIIKPHQLSSGEKQILLILLSTLLHRNNPYILLMDEPEISLHPDWQEKLITIIRKINQNAQIIMATHSPALVLEDWFGQIIDIDGILRQENK